MAEQQDEDADFRKLLESSWKGADQKVKKAGASVPANEASTQQSASATGAAPARSKLGRWGSLLQQVAEAPDPSAAAKPVSSSQVNDNADAHDEQQEDDETDWRKLLDSGWKKTRRTASTGSAVVSGPAKSSARAPGSSLGSCSSLLSKAPDEAVGAGSFDADKVAVPSVVEEETGPAADSMQEAAADPGDEDDLDFKSFLDAAWSKAKTVIESPPQIVEPEEAEFLNELAVEDEKVVSEDPVVEEDALEPDSPNMADEDVLSDVAKADLHEEEATEENIKDVPSEAEAETADECLDVAVSDDVELPDEVAEVVPDEVEEVVTFKGKDVGAVTVHAKVSAPKLKFPTAPTRKPPQHLINRAPAKASHNFLRPHAMGQRPLPRAPLPAGKLRAANVPKAAVHAVRTLHAPQAHFLRPPLPGMRPAAMRGGMPLAHALRTHAGPHAPRTHAGPHAFRPPQPSAAKHLGRQVSHGKAALMVHRPKGPAPKPGKFSARPPARPPAKPPAPKLPTRPSAKLPAKPSSFMASPGGQAGLKRPFSEPAQNALGVKRLRSDDGPLGALDAEGRRFDLKRVVVNFANVGATYGKKVLKREGCSKPMGLLDWEGVRRCVKYLAHNLSLKVVGVIHENYTATDNNVPSRVAMPQDIRRMCESIEETPRLEGANHKSADDEMTIKCAYHRNCRFLDNDNYRDWKQQLRDDRCRGWLEKYQDLLQMRYYFDSGVGIFETIDGNMPAGMLAKDQSAKAVTMATLWTAPRR